MLQSVYRLLLGGLLLCSATLVSAANINNGEKLYNGGCFSCHNTSIHTREDRIIFSKKALYNRVAFCDSQAGTHWSDGQILDVVEYLNDAFYKFKD